MLDDIVEQEMSETSYAAAANVDLLTPGSETSVPPRTNARDSDLEFVEESALTQMETHPQPVNARQGKNQWKSWCGGPSVKGKGVFVSVKGLSHCGNLLRSQSPSRQGLANPQESQGRPRLADY